MKGKFALILLLGLFLIPNLIVNAQAGCEIDQFTISPDETSYSQGISLELYGSSNCSTVSFEFNNEAIGEVGSGSMSATFQTDILDPGRHFLCFSGNGDVDCQRITIRRSIDTDDIDLSDCPTDFTRIAIGDEVTVYDGDPSALPMRELPGTDQDISKMIPIRNVLTIIEGPVCADDWRWWMVEHGDDIGWVGEVGPQHLYNLIPPTCAPHYVDFEVGDDIQVTEGLGNRVRSGAGLEYRVTDSVFNGTSLEITGESVCVDGWNWLPIVYVVQNVTHTGWIVEGDFRVPWVEPST